MSGEVPPELPIEQHALVAARIAVHAGRPRAEVLAPFNLSEAEWDALAARLTSRIVDEIRDRAGSSGPVEQRYPLATAYAKAYAAAVRDERRALEKPEDEATVRLTAVASSDEPFSVLGASNRAAASARSGSQS